MRVLQAGCTALEAVEAAIKVLEDKEIANAGFGSNLAIDGTVECDATIVDHLGRSGAVGAVSNIKNPVSLASLVLEHSRRPLSLRRVPPNLLVGEGARDFATEHGMPLVPNSWLVSRDARDRYLKWEQDLKRAEASGISSSPPASGATTSSTTPNSGEQDAHPGAYRDHAKAVQTGVWNEGQVDSPSLGSARGSQPTSSQASPLPSPGRSSIGRPPRVITGNIDKSPEHSHGHLPAGNHGGDAACDLPTITSDSDEPLHVDTAEEVAQDLITDTVGAIAIDQDGRIAAASSSGGIGMKHRGRVGPAALVGVGTSVIPQDDSDEEGVSVAAVTSGTGEHMATTMASQKCAERLYQWTRRGEGGADVAADDEATILDSFICEDFQKHPGVRNSTSAGAIGVMAVKKSKSGFYLYFAHNTDSFALASMASTDREPLCVMSRLRENNYGVSQGARKIHIK
ncbi:nucleophile aminohydrolase [Microdochium trichocladiopsis]|uniref:Nucleophile aminohydrolase n=1 Tax=Microdochium trichocladiopsis TaxID=1682393 RepID=A0A9P8YG99_9PEZI|nr:nucleophile aminohydrolase [Microdochium trichocladiopsis]KAH7039844.1 nucleophile aminohydrolase [Microdochium trichocladiopsis]